MEEVLWASLTLVYFTEVNLIPTHRTRHTIPPRVQDTSDLPFRDSFLSFTVFKGDTHHEFTIS
eukprot:scaffold3821_cov173-Amphora_coffeaeformis.AAC.3